MRLTPAAILLRSLVWAASSRIAKRLVFPGSKRIASYPVSLLAYTESRTRIHRHSLHGPLVYAERTAIILRKTSGSSVTSSFGPIRASEPGVSSVPRETFALQRRQTYHTYR